MYQDVIQLSNKIRATIVDMAEYSHGSMHWGGALSCVDILAALYGNDFMQNGKFILSKGHAAVALYATLYNVGKLSVEDIKTYQNNGSRLTELIEYNKDMNIECSGGSLGLGLPYAAGKALYAKKENGDYCVYVLLGDGEMNEGAVWEAIMFSSQMRLNNLTMIIDANQMQSDGNTESIISWKNLKLQFESFGWCGFEVDGHDVKQIENALLSRGNNDRPKAIIAHTIKGKGISFIENNNEWHDKKISKADLLAAEEEIRRSC